MSLPPLDGRCPERVYEPADERELADMVRGAARERVALVPVGGATAVQTGNPLDAARWAYVSTARVRGVADLSPADCVVTFRAGTTLAEARRALAEHRLLPTVDVPFPERATIGGITACNRQGLWGATFGAPRDRLLAVRAVLADGTVVKAGGKVVKTVAGYDLCKLFAGSWGTLAVIVEATFRVQPEPPERRALAYAARTARHAVDAALMARARMLDPVCLAVFGPPWRVYAEVWGNHELVEWVQRELAGVLGAAGLEPVCAPETDAVRDYVAGSHCTGAGIARVAALPTVLPAVLDGLAGAARAVLVDVQAGVAQAAFDAHAGPGEWRRLVGGLPSTARVTWPRVPDAWKERLDVWGEPGSGAPLMRAVKCALDPARTFNPGRFVGRI